MTSEDKKMYFKIGFNTLMYIIGFAFILAFFNTKCSVSSKMEHTQKADTITPLIKKAYNKILQLNIKSKRDSLKNDSLLKRIIPLEKKYANSKHKAIAEIKKGISDTNTTKQIIIDCDSLNQANKEALKADSLTKDNLYKTIDGWKYLYNQQELRHNQDTTTIHYLLNDSIPKVAKFYEKKGLKKGRKQGAVFGFGVSALVGTAVIVKP